MPKINRSESGVVVVGGGILGTTIAYWLSLLYEGEDIVLIEKENDVGLHTTRRNTGIIHRPFYLDPEKRKLSAESAEASYWLWKKYAAVNNLPWRETGTIEVALRESGREILRKYYSWGIRNGMKEEELQILDAKDIKKIEPKVFAQGAIFSKTDTSVDFYAFARSLKKDAEKRGVSFLLGFKVKRIEPDNRGVSVSSEDGRKIRANYLINAAGGEAVRLAHGLGVAGDFSDLNFRGEYSRVDPRYKNLASRNIYSLSRHQEFPFLDPHWVIRANGEVEIGPTAVPVLDAYAYSGFSSGFSSIFEKISDLPLAKFKVLFNPEFLNLAAYEWKSSFSKRALTERIREFLPEMKPEYLLEKGISGIRSSVIDKKGNFIKEPMDFIGPASAHILNFNSPGATGAPAYAAYIIRKLKGLNLLDHLKPKIWDKKNPWDFI